MIHFLAITGDSEKKPKKSTPPGAGWVPHIFFHPKSYFFSELKPHAKFQNPTINPFGRKVTRRKERKKERNREEKVQSKLV
jgi:hypothetical protein